MNGIRHALSTGLKQQQQQPHVLFPFPESTADDDDDDDDSLDSLEQLLPTDNTHVLHLYEWFHKEPSRNPISLLMQYYDDKAQRTLLQERDIRTSIRCESVLLNNIKKKNSTTTTTTTWWRFLFECPLSGMKASSGLPQRLLRDSSSSTALAEATRKFFAAEYALVDGVVYWDKKQAAKASCALVAILRLDPDRLELHDEAIPVFATELSVSTEEQNNHHPDTEEEGEFPYWVHTLFQLGIRKPEISFHQESREDYSCDDWVWSTPTRLYCKIFVREPHPWMVRGESSTCKTMALQSALQKLQLNIPSVKKLSPHNAANIRKGILQALPQTAHYDNSLPSWASAPFQPNSTYFLYELVVKAHSGKLLAEERIPWIQNKESCTRIGLLLPRDPLSRGDAPYADKIRFQSLVQDGKLVSCHVELLGRNVVTSDTVEGRKISNSLPELMTFNQLLMRWKQYGFGKQYDSRADALSFSDSNRNGLSTRDRTYLFVPLDSKSSEPLIDWHCIQETLHFKQARPLYDTNRGFWMLPYQGSIDSRFLSAIVCLFSCYATVGQDVWASKVFAILFLLWWMSTLWAKPSANFSESVIPNRFLRHCGDLYAPHTLAWSQTVTPNSKLVGFHVDAEKKKRLEMKLGIDLDKATFRDYYSKKYGVRVRYGNLPMVMASRIFKHADSNPIESQLPEPVFLVPELCSVLPLPRDLVYIIDQVDSFMPVLERKIDIRRLATSALNSCFPETLSSGTNLEIAVGLKYVKNFSQSFADLLDLATTRSSVTPATSFERLEFFGDRVLAFFVALALTGSYFKLSETLPTLYDSLSASTKNRSLSKAALEIGLPRLVLSKRCSWLSAHSCNHSQRGETVEFPDCFLSDIFEACVAASFLASQEGDMEFRLVKTLLEMAQLPVEGTSSTVSFSERKFYESAPLGKLNEDIVKEYFSVIPRTAFEKLKMGLGVIDRKLGTQLMSGSNNDIFRHSLILCSLYNAEVNYFAIYNENLCCSDMPGFAELKDTWSLLKMLSVIGCKALQLEVSRYLYQRYPCITAGDLHLLFSIVVSEDTLAYVFTKNGLHEALFDEGVADDFLVHSGRADIMGRESWHHRGGWIVPGGTEEFQKRSLTNRDPVCIGLRGGRLCGTTKKVGTKDTSGLVFSFHALIGAFVTTMGLESAWIYLRPLFTELMLLSPDEVREFSMSSLVENYHSGAKLNC